MLNDPSNCVRMVQGSSGRPHCALPEESQLKAQTVSDKVLLIQCLESVPIRSSRCGQDMLRSGAWHSDGVNAISRALKTCASAAGSAQQ